MPPTPSSFPSIPINRVSPTAVINIAPDFFNNGLCNRRGLFVSVFGEAPTQSSFRYFTRTSWEQWEDRVEKMLTPIILAAAKEQGIK